MIPSISVILPTYNRAQHLTRSVNSVLAQTYQDFELIIVDDGSTDDTRAHIADLADERLRYIRHEQNMGASKARNRGIQASRGQFIAFQDSDDEWLPDKLARQMQVMQKASPQVGAVYTSFWLVDGDRKHRIPSSVANLASRLPLRPTQLGGDIHQTLLNGNFITLQCTLMRRRCFDQIGDFDERLSRFQDWDLFLRLSQYGNIEYISDPLAKIYQIPGSLSTDPVAMIEAMEMIVRRYADTHGPSRRLLAQQALMKGDYMCRTGHLAAGRELLWQACRYVPSIPVYWILAAASYSNADLYAWTANAAGVKYAR